MQWLTKNRRAWARGLVAAFVGSAANAVTNVVIAPETFNIHEGLGKLGASALLSGGVGAALYLKAHPVWDEDEAARERD